jgi:CubicO group peptidase (beta-lactamase class C family)
MGSLAISKNGKVIYSRSIGYRYIPDDEKILSNTETKYRIWSATKMYTATMILQLIDEGKLKLETSLERFFPTIANAKFITIQEMLGHKSGVHDFTKPEKEGPTISQGQTQSDMVEMISRFKSDFQPGEKYQYSNSNYLLLGYIIERIDSVPYSVALYNRISSRIGLSDTYFGVGSLDGVENKSFSYEFVENRWSEVSEGDFSGLVPGGAGGIVSTPSEMNRFIESLFTGKLISKGSLSLMTDIKDFYGLGIFLMPYNGVKGFGHTGGYIASHSSLFYYPQDSLAIAYCTNGQVKKMEYILGQVLGIYFDKSYVLPINRVEIELSEEALEQYVGVYETPQFLITVTLEATHLTAQPDGQPKSTLFAFKRDFFFIKELAIEIEFGSDEMGNVDKLYIHQAGRKMQARKIK